MSIATSAERQRTSSEGRADGIVDSDVHNTLASNDLLRPYLSQRWTGELERFGLRRPDSIGFFSTRPRKFAARTDAWPVGGVPGGDLELMREQLLDRFPIAATILNPINQTTVGAQPAAFSAALCRALNELTLAEWIEADERLYGAICVPCEDARLAAEEAHRLGDHPRFVQLLVNVRTREPLGNRSYWPLYEAAVEHGLPVAVHVGGHGGNTITGSGWPSYYFEDHAGYPQAFQSQLISLVFEGVFERYPDLKIVLQEGGFAWMSWLMWRMDSAWRRLRDEVPHLERPPSEIVREHFWFTTQPIEEPERPQQFAELWEDVGMPTRALFASDYPHWDFDAPDRALPSVLDAETKRAVLGGNARALYPQLADARVPVR
ncbi:MAG: amidohydrolase [Actinobacteria bacterium]|nr:amidohydrolase [Actinomycetota bacterium]